MRLAIILALLPLSAKAQSCTDFWYFKERVLQVSGKCPSSPEAEALFGTDGCSDASPLYRGAENYLAHVDDVLAGPCRGEVNLKELTPQRRAALSVIGFLPMMEDGMGMWCEGWQGARLTLRSSPKVVSPIVGHITAGQGFASVAEMEGDWVYLAGTTSHGWTQIPDGGIAQCDRFAG